MRGVADKAYTTLSSGWTLLVMGVWGVYIGLYQHDLVQYVAPLGHIYLDLLKMCILPVLLSSIAVSTARILQTHDSGGLIGKMLVVFVLSMVTATLVGMLVGTISQVGIGIDNNTMGALGNIVRDSITQQTEISSFEPAIVKEDSFFKSFVDKLIPDNIFSALSDGSNLKVLFFSIVFGSAMGLIDKSKSDSIISFLDALYTAFSVIIKWLMVLLPFALVGLMADNIDRLGASVLVAMMHFIPTAIVAFALFAAFNTALMWYRMDSLADAFRAIRGTSIIAMSTANTMSCIPSTMSGLIDELGYDRRSVDLIVPMSLTICRVAPSLYFALATLFVTHLYGIGLGAAQYLVIFIGSILAAFSTAGTSGVAILGMLSLILEPLELPSESVIVLFIVIEPVIGIFRTLVNAHACYAITSLILPRRVTKT